MNLALFAAISLLSGLICAPVKSGDVIDLRHGFIYGRNDGIPKRVITDGKKVLVVRSPKSAFPKAGDPFGSSSAGSISPETNDVAQNSLYSPSMQELLRPDNYSGPDNIGHMYDYYINIPYIVGNY